MLVGLLHLTEDLCFADDHRIERGDDAEEVPNDRLAVVHVEVADEFVAVETVIVGHEVDDGAGAVGLGRGDRVDLRAVAGGDDDGLGHVTRGGKQRKRFLLAVSGERELLANLDGGGLVAQAN